MNFRDTEFNALESNIPCDSKGVSTEFDEKLNSYIKTAVVDNNFKNQTLDQTLKQIYLSKVKGKDRYQPDLFNWLCSEKGKRKINLMNKKLV